MYLGHLLFVLDRIWIEHIFNKKINKANFCWENNISPRTYDMILKFLEKHFNSKADFPIALESAINWVESLEK